MKITYLKPRKPSEKSRDFDYMIQLVHRDGEKSLVGYVRKGNWCAPIPGAPKWDWLEPFHPYHRRDSYDSFDDLKRHVEDWIISLTRLSVDSWQEARDYRSERR